MGKGSKPEVQVADYRMSVHIGLCHAVAQRLHQIFVGEKRAWRGLPYATAEETLTISKPGLFGGFKKEGGVSGSVRWMPGLPTQTLSSFLAGKIGLTPSTSPAYRGVTSAWFTENPGDSRKGFYWSSNQPYLKPVWFELTRLPCQGDDPSGVEWYPERSQISCRDTILRRSVMFALDTSGSMETEGRIDVLKSAMGLAFDRIQEAITANSLDIDISVVLWNNTASRLDKTHASVADVELLRDFVDAATTDNTTNFDLPAQEAVSWFGASSGDSTIAKRLFIFVTDGLPVPLSSSDTAATTMADLIDQTSGTFNSTNETQVDCFGINIVEADTSETEKLDNTPNDLVPVTQENDATGLLAAIEWALFQNGTKPDSNPMHIIVDCLTNREWGMGYPLTALDLDAFRSAADVLVTEGFGLSFQWVDQTQIEALVQEVLDHIEATLFIAPRTGLITPKLIRDDYDEATLRTLDATNFKVSSAGRKALGDTVNEVVVKWTNPLTEDMEAIRPAQDLANINMQGSVVSETREYYAIRCKPLAETVAQRDIRVASAPLASCEGEVDRSFWDVVPGEVVKVDLSEYAMGTLIMRVGNVDYGKADSPSVKISLVEDIFAFAPATVTGSQDGQFEDPASEPAEASDVKIVTLPYHSTVNLIDPAILANVEYPEVFAGVLVAYSDADGVDFDLYGTVTDVAGNESFGDLGTRQFTSLGSLQSPLAAEAESTVDNADFGSLTTGDGPVVGGFVLIGDGEDDETELAVISAYSDPNWTLWRGVLDTVPRAWPIGTEVRFLAPATSIQDNTPRSDGETVDYKVLPRTSQDILDISQAATVSQLLSDRPWLPSRPADVTVDGIAFGTVDGSAKATESPVGDFLVEWANRNRETEDGVVLRWDAATVTGEAGQTTKITVMDADRNVLTTHSSLSGTSFSVPLSSFEDGSPAAVVDFGIIRVTAVKGGLESLQGHELIVFLQSVPDGALLLSGDEQGSSPPDESLVLSGDMQDSSPASDALQTSTDSGA